MKKLLVLIALALLGTACQHQAPTTQATTATPTPAVAVSAPLPVAPSGEKPLPVLFKAADTLDPADRHLLQRYDLSSLWQGSTKERRERPVLEGFFGPDHYRFRVVFTQVRRDSQHPEVYQVKGKCHYRQNIRSFVGTLTMRRLEEADVYFSPVASLVDVVYANSPEPDSFGTRYERATRGMVIYSAWARLQLTEETSLNSGIFEGEAELNFCMAPDGRVGYAQAPSLNDTDPARGGWLLLRGSRRNVSTRQVKQFVVADDVFAASPDVYKDFGVGDRGQEINPKYAKLGWNTYWQNDEWWADSPKPKLNL